jgi:enamine deaminase RidA (YjgF/YER057c/UK114 family)
MIERLDSGEILSQATIHNGVAYICGQTATDRSADIKGQTAEVLAKIDDRLARCGTDKSKMLMVTIYLSDMSQKAGMNEVWTAWMGTLPRPARACVGTPLATADTLVEIVVSAAI